MNSEILEQLLADVKDYLQISWTDEATDRRLTDIIQSSVAYLDTVTAEASDYMEPGLMRTLLFERVRYQYNGALDAWLPNYLSMVIDAQNAKRVRDYASGQESTV